MKTIMASILVGILVAANLAAGWHIRSHSAPVGFSCYAPDGWAFNTCKDADGDRRWAI